MTKIHPCDEYGRTAQRYTIRYKELHSTWYGGRKIITKQFAFKNKSSWTYYHARKIVKMLDNLGYKLVEIIPCRS